VKTKWFFSGESYDCAPADAARAFLLPGMHHHVGNLLSRYYLTMELCRSAFSEPEDTRSTTVLTAVERALEDYHLDVGSYFALVHMISMPPERLYERFLSGCGSQDVSEKLDTPEADGFGTGFSRSPQASALSLLLRLLQSAAARRGVQLRLEEPLFHIDTALGEYLFLPLALLVSRLSECAARGNLQLGVLDDVQPIPSGCEEAGGRGLYLLTEKRYPCRIRRTCRQISSVYPALYCRPRRDEGGFRIELKIDEMI